MKEINKIYNEPCLETLKNMDDKSIDCVITSPPYWQLRDYGYDGQWGLEPKFQEYLEHLWEMMNEIYRVLKDEGTCWINLGDSYSTQSGTNAALARGKNYSNNSTYILNRGESKKLIKPKNIGIEIKKKDNKINIWEIIQRLKRLEKQSFIIKRKIKNIIDSSCLISTKQEILEIL